MNSRRYLLLGLFFAANAVAQQQGTPAKTNEQQARSYISSAFITGAAPSIISDKVVVSPPLRQELGLGPDASGAAVYKALMDITAGKHIVVRHAAGDEIDKSQAPAPVSEQPVFAMEAGDSTIIVQYDLARDHISFVGLPGAVATAKPVMAPAPPEKVAEASTPAPAPAAPPTPTVVEAPKPTGTVVAPATGTVVAPAAATPPPAPEQKPLQVVEPQIPRAVAKPAAPMAVAAAPRPAEPMFPEHPPLKKSGPCEIKPVMTDQDLVNCGATPR